MLQAFQGPANRGGLHSEDEKRLNNLIYYISRQEWNIDDALNEIYSGLISQESAPWSVESAQEIVRRVRMGVELLRYEPDDV